MTRSAVFTDDFSGDLSAWTQTNAWASGNCTISGGVLRGVGTGIANWAHIVRSAGTYGNDQYCKATIGSLAFNDTNYGGVVCVNDSGDVSTSGAQCDYYGAVVYDNASSGSAHTCALVKVLNGSPATLGATESITYSSGDTVEIESHDNGDSTVTLTFFKNGVAQFTRDDTSSVLTGGRPSLGLSVNTTVSFDDAEGGNVTTSSTDQKVVTYGADDGNEASHTLGTQDAALTGATVGDKIIARFLIDATGDPASASYSLRYNKNGGAFGLVPVGATTPGSPADTGQVFPASGTTQDRSGATAWTNPGNITVDDTSDATAAVPTDYLIATNFDFSAIPDGSTINGVTVRVNASETGTGSSNYVPQLVSAATPTLIGTAKSAVTVTGTTKVLSTNGSTSDVWGATLTAAIVKNSGFGVAIWSTDTVNTLAIDYITIDINYTPPATTNEVFIADSTNVGAGGTATTARMTPPAGKTSGDFVAGRLLDDANSYTLDIGADQYTELGFVVDTQAPLVADDSVKFRIYKDGVALNGYSSEPQWLFGELPIAGTLAATESAGDTAALAGPGAIPARLYYVIYPTALGAPSATQIKAGQDINGDPAVASGDEVAPTTDTDPFDFAQASGLTASTAYKASYVWSYGDSGSDSNVVTTAEFTTAAGAGVSGTLAATEGASDSLAATGDVLVLGTLAATEAGADTFAAAGDVIVQGALAATESGADTFSSSGDVVVAGVLAVTEGAGDTLAADGSVLVSGSLAATDAADTAAATGSVLVQGDLAATDGADTFAASGANTVTGSMAATEGAADTLEATGDVIVAGSLATAESAGDTAAASGKVIVQGDLAATDGQDTFSASGGAVALGTLAATETGSDSFAATGQIVVSGVLAVTESGADTAAGAGKIIVAGSMAAAETADGFSAVGVVIVQGSMAAAESGADTFAANGGPVRIGTMAATEQGADTLAGSGLVVVAGNLAVAESGGDSFAATGKLVISGLLAAIESGGDQAALAGDVIVQGILAAIEASGDHFSATNRPFDSTLKVWTGAAWVTAPVWRWDGSGFVPLTMKVRNGPDWLSVDTGV